MAVPSSTAKAVRDVLIAQKFRPSAEPEGFDTATTAKLHKQFFLRGPVLADTVNASQQANEQWQMGIVFGWMPAGDADHFRFEMADAVSALHAAMVTDSTILSDAFNLQSHDPEFDEELGVWRATLVVEWWVYQSVSA
ncbi:MAG: hypothetical protein ACPGWS_07850 [Solirubrobacterales bacterium]